MSAKGPIVSFSLISSYGHICIRRRATIYYCSFCSAPHLYVKEAVRGKLYKTVYTVQLCMHLEELKEVRKTLVRFAVRGYLRLDVFCCRKMSAIVHDCVQEVEARRRIIISRLMQCTINTFHEENKFNNLSSD
jgi:hypothetical protein